jgi:hypothetical protein
MENGNGSPDQGQATKNFALMSELSELKDEGGRKKGSVIGLH